MIEVKNYIKLREIVPQSELQEWRARIKRIEAQHCPIEVRQFIEALSAKLGDFGEIRKYDDEISGYELQLAGMKQFKGEPINAWEVYNMPMPFMVAVDHPAAMHRIFHRRGKQGLIDFCKAKVRGTELERLLEILTVHVFKQEREEFKQVMRDIENAKKLDSI